MCDLLWSDPQEIEGRSPSKRGVGCQFGPDVTAEFCSLNDIDYVVRYVETFWFSLYFYTKRHAFQSKTVMYFITLTYYCYISQKVQGKTIHYLNIYCVQYLTSAERLLWASTAILSIWIWAFLEVMKWSLKVTKYTTTISALQFSVLQITGIVWVHNFKKLKDFDRALSGSLQKCRWWGVQNKECFSLFYF